MNQEQKFKELIEVLTRWDESHINGCIILHFNKETKRLESISPMLQVGSIAELMEQMLHARDAIQGLLDDLMNKGLAKN